MGACDEHGPLAIVTAIGCVPLELLVFVIVRALVETSLAELRLFRIPEFLAIAFVVCLFAVSLPPVGIF